jgi:hypothetical protein
MSYTFAGTSVLNGSLKVRFANSDARAKQLVKLGDTDVNIVPLPSVMDKVSAVAYLLDSGFAKTDTIRLALEAEVAPKAKPKSVTKTVKVRAKIATKSKPVVKSTEPTEEEVDRLYNAVYGNK